MSPKAVIMVGFGRPPSMAEVTSFLYEIFSDPVASPFSRLGIFRKPVARLIAIMAAGRARKRYLNVADNPDSFRAIGGLAERLEQRLADAGTKVMVAMRYGEPSIERVSAELVRYGFDEACVIPLFPHRTTSTSGTIEAAFKKTALKIKMINSWYKEDGFISAWADSIKKSLGQFDEEERKHLHLIFSAHAIPVYHQKLFGDNYAGEILESARFINDKLGGGLPMSVAYQSRAPLGRWTGPSLEDELMRIGRSGGRCALIVPISFIYDNVETWCDLDLDIIPNKAKFGLDKIVRASPPLQSDGIIDALANKVSS